MSFSLLLISESVLGALVAATLGLFAAKQFKGGAIATAIKWIVASQVFMSLGQVLIALQLSYGNEPTIPFFAGPWPDILFKSIITISILCSIVGFLKFWLITKPQN